MKKKRDVTLKGEWIEFAAKLPERLRGKVLDALTRYALTGEMPDADTETEKAVMRCVEPSAERARRISEARRRANAARTTRAGGNPAFAKGKPNPYYPKKDNCKDNNKDNNKTAFCIEKSRNDKGKDINKNRAAAGNASEKDNNKITTKIAFSLNTSLSYVHVKKFVYLSNLRLATNYSIPTNKYILYIYPSSLEERQREGIDNGVHIDNIDGMDRMSIENRTYSEEDRAMNDTDKTESDKPIVWYSDGERTIPFDEADIEYIDDGEANVAAFSEFSKRMGLIDDIVCPGSINDCDWRKIARAYERSSWLRETPVARSEKWIIKNHRSIEGGAYEDRGAARACDAVDELLRKMKEDGEI